MVFNFFYGTVPQQGQGSGFVLDKAGHVLTNYHVVEGANRGIEVMLSNKRRYAAKVVGTDKVHDLALLQIDAPNLQPVTLADSTQLNVGQKVYAIGNPFGLSGTMTRGIISSIRVDSRRGRRAHRGRDSDRRGHQSRQLRRAACSIRAARSSESTP